MPRHQRVRVRALPDGPRTRVQVAQPARRPEAAEVIALQRRAGNQAMRGLLAIGDDAIARLTASHAGESAPRHGTPGNRAVVNALGGVFVRMPATQLQRRVLFSTHGGKITKVSITGRRPPWWKIAKQRHPSQKGYDRRHVLAWSVIKRGIEAGLKGQTLPAALKLLTDPTHFSDAGWAAKGPIPKVLSAWKNPSSRAKAIEYYAAARFNDPGNLFMGPAKPNRALGARILPAYKDLVAVLQARKSGTPVDLDEKLPKPKKLKFQFWDKRTNKLDQGIIPITTLRDVVDWYANMAIDWNRFIDWESATDKFLSHLGTIDAPLAHALEAGAAARNPKAPQ